MLYKVKMNSNAALESSQSLDSVFPVIVILEQICLKSFKLVIQRDSTGLPQIILSTFSQYKALYNF